MMPPDPNSNFPSPPPPRKPTTSLHIVQSSPVRSLANRHQPTEPRSLPLSSFRSSGTTAQSDTQSPLTVSPVERLNQLTADIWTVLQAYANLPARSPLFLASLQDFHDRAIALHPTASHHRRPSDSAIPHSPPPPQSRNVPELEMKEVEELEREWWGSEVVAAWYGPRVSPRTSRRPGGNVAHASRGTSRRRVEAEIAGEEEGLKRGASYVGLHDE